MQCGLQEGGSLSFQRDRRRVVAGLSWQLSFSREVGPTLPKQGLMATNNLQDIYCIYHYSHINSS